MTLSAATRRPLDGVRVLDLTRVVSGPVLGRILGDLGADVVKVEPPEGDVTRLWGHVRNGTPGFFLQQNASKRGMCVDLRVPSAAAVVIELARAADVLIENFRGGVMDRLGLGWSVMREVNPRLVMCSISGFGQSGPESHRPAFAAVIQAEAGFLHRQMGFDQRPPSDPIASVADYNAGLHGAIGVLAALVQAKATGVGDHLDIAMIDSMMATDDYMHFALDEMEPVRLGGEYYQTGDDLWTVISGPTNQVFRDLAKTHGLVDPSSAEDGPKIKLVKRREALRTWIRSIPNRDSLIPLIEAAKLPWGALHSPTQAVQSPTAVHRGSVTTVIDSGGEERKLMQTPYRYAQSTTGARSRSPHLGEHNGEVLREWLGWELSRIDDLTEAGALLSGPVN